MRTLRDPITVMAFPALQDGRHSDGPKCVLVFFQLLSLEEEPARPKARSRQGGQAPLELTKFGGRQKLIRFLSSTRRAAAILKNAVAGRSSIRQEKRKRRVTSIGRREASSDTILGHPHKPSWTVVATPENATSSRGSTGEAQPTIEQLHLIHLETTAENATSS